MSEMLCIFEGYQKFPEFRIINKGLINVLK